MFPKKGTNPEGYMATFLISHVRRCFTPYRSQGSPTFGALAGQSNVPSFGAVAGMPATQGFGGMQQPQQTSPAFGSFGGGSQ